MKALPIPAELMTRLTAAGATSLTLNFRGGSDEGFLEVTICGNEDSTDNSLDTDVYEWAEEAYDYGGAGDGNDYGDDFTYDFTTKTVSSSEWSMQRTDGESDEQSFDDL